MQLWPDFYRGSKDSNSGSMLAEHVCISNEPSFQPPQTFKKKFISCDACICSIMSETLGNLKCGNDSQMGESSFQCSMYMKLSLVTYLSILIGWEMMMM